MKISFVELENYYPIQIAKWLENTFRRFESVYRPEMMREQSSARKCIYKISKNFRVEKSGEISRNLRFSRFFVPASKSDTHHGWDGQI